MEAPRRIGPTEAVPEEIRERLRIYIDGDLLRDIVAYDVDRGFVMVIGHGDCGERIQSDDCYTLHRYYGDVQAVIL